MPRLFSGISIPAPISHKLSLINGKLPGARWIDSADYHLTLRFMGDISEEAAQELDILLSRTRLKPFSLCIDMLDVFGARKPRSLYARVRSDEALCRLQKDHEAIARQIGLKPEGRNFTPHITLARFRGNSNEHVARYLASRGMFNPLQFEVDGFRLFSAKPSVGGGPYLIERSYLFSSQ